jgi:hypothetical protein
MHVKLSALPRHGIFRALEQASWRRGAGLLPSDPCCQATPPVPVLLCNELLHGIGLVLGVDSMPLRRVRGAPPSLGHFDYGWSWLGKERRREECRG